MTNKLKTTETGRKTLADELAEIAKADASGKLRAVLLIRLDEAGEIEQFVSSGDCSRIELMGLVADLAAQVNAQKL